MYWVLQNNIFNEAGFRRLHETLERLQLPFSEHKVVPFIGELQPEPVVPSGMNAIVMGSYSMANYARRKGWYPGSFDNDNLDYEKQVPHWGSDMLNSDAHVCRFADVPVQQTPFFIRPTLDSKSFTGYRTDWPSFVEWQQRVLDLAPEDNPIITPETMVQVCAAKTIHREYRLWVVDGRVVTASLYKLGDKPNYSSDVEPAVVEYGEKIAQRWSPARAYVLDVCDTPNGLRVLEAGCMNAAGFYAADMHRLVAALEDTFGAITND